MAEKLIRCSFCGKTQAQVKRIMSGPNAYICNECVELCSTILHEEMYETGSSELTVPDHLPTPKEIKEYMDGYIIGQDEAKLRCSRSFLHHSVPCSALTFSDRLCKIIMNRICPVIPESV